MRYPGLLLTALLPIMSMPTPAAAQAVGIWRVNGEISGKAFVLECRLGENGAQVSGVCTEIEKNGKRGKQHVLSRGSVNGPAIRWTYPTKVMMMSIDIDFSGTRNGANMTGSVLAKGRQGVFSAQKL